MVGKQTIVATLLVLSAVGPPAVTANEPPLADAGLDQEVEREATVLLDGTGSRDPDGNVTGYDWRIEAPNDTVFRPDCPDCGQTRFRPTQPGRYDVQVTVTDDDGATSNDTLYVTVEGSSEAEGPSVDLRGEETPTVDEQVTYTAEPTAGDAPLTSVTWSVDGEDVATRDATSRRDKLRTAFGSTASRTVAVRVTDESNRSARATLSVDPRSREPVRDSTTGPIAPTISGPRLLTGDPPFKGTYTLESVGGVVADVNWVTTGDPTTSDGSADVGWEPGRQQIYAEVTDGFGNVHRATFPDGNTTVVVDPGPDIELSGATTSGTVFGDAIATDDFGNLERLTIRANETVLTEVDAENEVNTSELSDGFSVARDRIGEQVTAVAVDARGQRAEAIYRLGGRPEIVSTGFVNDPVDSYHPRIDESRYAGEHVVRIDLNGADPDSVSVDVSPNNLELGVPIEKASSGRAYLPESDTLVYRSYWGSQTNEDVKVTTEVHYEGGETTSVIDRLDVTPSPPEVRVRVLDDGRNTGEGPTNHDQATNWGITVDASRSFDPDGSSLEFVWTGGASSINNNRKVGRFHARKTGSLEVIDSQDQVSVWRYRFHGSYNPGIERIEPITEGPYSPDETVRFRVITPLFQTTKNRYNVTVDAEIEGKGRITGEELVPYRETVDSYDRDFFGYERYEWTVAVPASRLFDAEGTPHIRTHNPKRPGETTKYRSLPSVDVSGDAGTPTDLRVEDLQHLVERQRYEEVTAKTREALDSYRDDGYRVVSQDASGIIYRIEKNEKVRNATYETRRRTFRSPQVRKMFLETNPEWRGAGSNRKTETRTITETQWRDSYGGRGEFTGETRRVKVEDARYLTEHQYVTTRTTTETVTRERLRCFFRTCVIVDVRDTITKTEKDYYWSTAGGLVGRPTGETRRKLVDPPEYETRYRYEVTRHERRTVTEYVAERTVQTSPATYEWRHYETTKDRAYAKTLAEHSDRYRIESTKPDREWTLRRPRGSERRWVSSLEDGDSVLRTSGTIHGKRIANVDGSTVKTGTIEEEVSADGKLSPSGLIDRYLTSHEEGTEEPERVYS